MVSSAVTCIYKPEGISPLEAMELLKKEYPEYAALQLSYAGRLDPMAEGLVLVVGGEERFKKDEYLALDKTYEAAFLLGIQTDSDDILGLVEKVESIMPDAELTKNTLRSMEGKISLRLPSYSSYKISGKPLFQWAREGKISQIDVPVRTTEVKHISHIESDILEKGILWKQIQERVGRVHGDFRQAEILETWEASLEKSALNSFIIVHATIACTSGTYIRSIARELGKRLHASALLLSLKRIQIGPYTLKDALFVTKGH